MKKNYYLWSCLALVLMALSSCSKSEQEQVSDLDVFGFNGPVVRYVLAEVETDEEFSVPDSAIAIQSFEFEDGWLTKINDVDFSDSGKEYDEMGRLSILTTPCESADGAPYNYIEELSYENDDDILPSHILFLYSEQNSDSCYAAGYKMIFYDEDGLEASSFVVLDSEDKGLDVTANFYDITSTDDYGNWTCRKNVSFSMNEIPEELSMEYLLTIDPNPVHKLEYQVIDYDE